MNFTNEILSVLKRKYKCATHRTMKSDSSMKSSQAEFYFASLDDNLIEPMNEKTLKEYGEGSGNELGEKMRAIRSSSAMTYNLFGNDNAVISSDTFFDQGSYEVFYEKQLPTIKNNPHNANLDAFLKGNTELIFCEMKMTEWLFNRPSDLRESYLDKSLYYDPEAYEAFRECISCLINWEPSDYRTYRSRFERYDAFQMLKHTMAIYNYAFQNQESIPKKIRLVNCVWELKDVSQLSDKAKGTYLERLKREHQEYSDFYISTKAIRNRFSELGYDFDILYMNAADFICHFQKTGEQKEYLKRYF